jgi:hypothetical protein
MPENRVAKHLRELAMAARTLEQEGESPKASRGMKKLAMDYDALAGRIERMEEDRHQLVIHTRQCREIMKVIQSRAHKVMLTEILHYLEGKLTESVGPKD